MKGSKDIGIMMATAIDAISKHPDVSKALKEIENAMNRLNHFYATYFGDDKVKGDRVVIMKNFEAIAEGINSLLEKVEQLEKEIKELKENKE